jgi:uncharacterized membrane protein YhaH (DUF805 family)
MVGLAVELIFFGIVLWICWHFFLRDKLKSSGISKAVKVQIASRQIPDENFYGQAMKELHSGELKDGFWAKALSQAEGDKSKAEALYIKLRVETLKYEAASEVVDGSAPAAPLVGKDVDVATVACTSCDEQVILPRNDRRRILNLHCNKCGYEFMADTEQGNRVIGYPSPDGQTIGRVGRATYFWMLLAWFAGVVALNIFVKEGGLEPASLSSPNGTTFLWGILMAFHVAIHVARMRDIDRSSWLALISLVPVLNLVLIFICLVAPGSPGRNKYGKKDIGLFVS